MIVTAPLVIAKLANGSDVYLYENVEVPDGLKDGEADRLKDAGLIGDPTDEATAPRRGRKPASE